MKKIPINAFIVNIVYHLIGVWIDERSAEKLINNEFFKIETVTVSRAVSIPVKKEAKARCKQQPVTNAETKQCKTVRVVKRVRKPIRTATPYVKSKFKAVKTDVKVLSFTEDCPLEIIQGFAKVPLIEVKCNKSFTEKMYFQQNGKLYYIPKGVMRLTELHDVVIPRYHSIAEKLVKQVIVKEFANVDEREHVLNKMLKEKDPRIMKALKEWFEEKYPTPEEVEEILEDELSDDYQREVGNIVITTKEVTGKDKLKSSAPQPGE